MWFWICLVISVVFLIFWFWFGQRLIGRNNPAKLFIRVILIIVMADCLLTLIGQPSGYWQDYFNCEEASIIGTMLLRLHPLAFTLGSVFWVILATVLINKLAQLFSYVIFFALSIGHSLGVWSWIQPQLKYGIEFLIGEKITYSQNLLYEEISNYLFLIFLALILAFVLKKVHNKK